MVFEHLAPDLVGLIAAKLPCRLDRANMAAVCPSWRDALQVAPAPHPRVPMLLFPQARSPHLDVQRYPICLCFLCRGDGKPISIPEHATFGRFFGSFEDSWIFFAMDQIFNHQAVNLRTGDQVSFPDTMVFESGGTMYSVVIETTTLSAAPVPHHSMGAAIVERWLPNQTVKRELMFWELGKATGWGLVDRTVCPNNIEDILHLDGSFVLLTNDEQIRVVRPLFAEGDWFLNAEVDSCYFGANINYYPEFVRSRYLVRSRGELLMVSRCQQSVNGRWYTSSFRVFRMDALPGAENGFAWTELENFDGRMIFVARGCSRAYEVTDFPGWHCAEGVYFKGDVDFWSLEWALLPPLARSQMMDDHGVWLGPPFGPILPCFELPQQVAGDVDFSPPVWIYPGGAAPMAGAGGGELMAGPGGGAAPMAGAGAGADPMLGPGAAEPMV